MDILPLTGDDLPSLAALYTQFWGEESSLERMRATWRRLSRDPDYILLGAKEEGVLVGSILGIVCEELYGECRPFMVMEDLVVDAARRRKGVGALLLRELERRAVERGCGYILFVTEASRSDARSFYEAQGYSADTHKGFKKRLAGHSDARAI